ncbi:hypothetical protein DFR50_101150 [Roseiarcus fermentans]|uniref:Homeodomain-like domain-containing protein n=1 Tax=Roseiarcus fermentans TaxID=1473586 RepID=A0A366FVN0_9HYPH|nr:hypothetical protein [Roseiarcus fermentans]RBP18206.1 hypothetical protein DFR50_101150 [Roseiarcus fermentans]
MSAPKSPSADARRDRSPAAREAARRKKAEREARVVGLLAAGLSVAEIARREGVTERGFRKSLRGLIARREPQAPARYAAVQANRLHEALRQSFDAMSGGDLAAVDRVVAIVRELDLHHGFAAPGRRRGGGDGERSVAVGALAERGYESAGARAATPEPPRVRRRSLSLRERTGREAAR